MTSPGDVYWPVIEAAYDAVSLDADPNEVDAALAEWPLKVRHLLAAHWCINVVMGGGLASFFWNSTGVLSPLAVDGLRAMGLPDLAELVEEGMSRIGRPYPRDTDERQRLLWELSPYFEYMEQPDEEDAPPPPFADLDDRLIELLEGQESGDGGRFEAAADRYAVGIDPPQ